MQKITSSKLAELLQNGFEGEIQFSGRVLCCLEAVMSNTLYENSGRFSLATAERKNGYYLMKNEGSEFYFKPKEGKPITPERGVNLCAISFPIEVPEKAVLMIDPEEIFF
ncbi:MAG: hypothetical protein AABW93_02305 [Nanoarchaeota archaeon]